MNKTTAEQFREFCESYEARKAEHSKRKRQIRYTYYWVAFLVFCSILIMELHVLCNHMT